MNDAEKVAEEYFSGTFEQIRGMIGQIEAEAEARGMMRAAGIAWTLGHADAFAAIERAAKEVG